MRFKKVVPAHEVVVDGKVTCDLCGKVLAEEQRGWARPEVTIEAAIGDIFPETDARTFYEVDVCSGCFLDKVLPTLRAIGLNVRERDALDDTRAWEVFPGAQHGAPG